MTRPFYFSLAYLINLQYSPWGFMWYIYKELTIKICNYKTKYRILLGVITCYKTEMPRGGINVVVFFSSNAMLFPLRSS